MHLIAKIDLKIREAEEALDFWRKAKEVAASPLFAQLSLQEYDLYPSDKSSNPFNQLSHLGDVVRSAPYGELKRLALQCLPSDSPMTPQGLTEAIAKTGYTFRTRTPSISVNDSLNSLKVEGKVKLVGKSASNAGLWLRVSDEEKGKGKEATEVAS